MQWRVLISAFAVALSPLAQGAGFETFNQSSLARAAALPALGQGAVLKDGVVENSVALDWSNEFFQRSNAREALTVDGESLRLGLRYQRGIGRDLEWSLELPLLFTGGGVQDSLIENWHSAFGLPNSNRGDAPQDRYRIRYVRDGVTVVDRNKGSNGLGDLRLGAGYALTEQWALRGLVQLPTGSKNKLTGGHVGAALWTDYTLPLSDSGRAQLTLSAGASVAGKDGPLQAQQQQLVGVAGAVLTVPLFGALDGVVQVNGHTKLYKGSTFAPLSKAALPLVFGLRWPWRGMVFDLAVTEDPSVNASPDFGVLFGVKVLGD